MTLPALIPFTLAFGLLPPAGRAGQNPPAAAPAATPSGMPLPETAPARPFRFSEATIEELQEQMRSGALTSGELTAAYLRRIDEIDRSGPALHAVLEVNPDALAIARQRDAERKTGRVRGPLHGIPVLLKDSIDTADRMSTTAGSLALVGCRPKDDAALVARLREAGAVILGKTNLTEWLNGRALRAVGGWSGRGGQTRNPYALDRDPSGSSSGSAVAVSANLCAVAVGTETDGSIVCPSSVNGIVGIKPTVGLISRYGTIPMSPSQDTAGAMARTVRDAAILLGVLGGPDPRDPATLERPAGLSTDYLASLKPGGLKGARLGILHGPFGFNPKMDAVLARAARILRQAGAQVTDPVTIPAADQLRDLEGETLLYEFKAGMSGYLGRRGPGCAFKTLADLISFNQEHGAEELKYFGQERFLLAQEKGPLTSQAYLVARAKFRREAEAWAIDALLRNNRIDALVAPTNGPACLIDPVGGDSSSGGTSQIAAIGGCPSVTVPLTQISGLPVGLSFMGPKWSEAHLLRLALDFEDRTHARRPPTFASTVAAISPVAVPSE